MSKWQFDRQFFFTSVRDSIFGGTLTHSQIENMENILDAIVAEDVRNPFWIGAVLATARIEVGAAMKPVREGFAKTDAGARHAVAQLYREGKIKTNYAKPDPVTGLSYYGRGYPQTTYKENYLKTGQALGMGDTFVNEPDKLLDPFWAARGMAVMMVAGGYRAGKSLASTLGIFPLMPSKQQIIDSRDIINGDKNKRRGRTKKGPTIGEEYAGYVLKFANAVKIDFEAPVIEPKVDISMPEVQNTPHSFWQKLTNWFINGEWK